MIEDSGELPTAFWVVFFRSGDSEIVSEADGRELQQALNSSTYSHSVDLYECTCIDGAQIFLRLTDVSLMKHSTPAVRQRDAELSRLIADERKQRKLSMGWNDDDE